MKTTYCLLALALSAATGFAAQPPAPNPSIRPTSPNPPSVTGSVITGVVTDLQGRPRIGVNVNIVAQNVNDQNVIDQNAVNQVQGGRLYDPATATFRIPVNLAALPPDDLRVDLTLFGSEIEQTIVTKLSGLGASGLVLIVPDPPTYNPQVMNPCQWHPYPCQWSPYQCNGWSRGW